MKTPLKKRIDIPYETRLKEKARELRKNPTPAEKDFWYALGKMPFSKTLRFNRQKPLGSYIVDFYCHERGLVIEIDGDTHGGTEAQENDLERTRFLESFGLKVVRFANQEVLHNVDGVMTTLNRLIEEGDI